MLSDVCSSGRSGHDLEMQPLPFLTHNGHARLATCSVIHSAPSYVSADLLIPFDGIGLRSSKSNATDCRPCGRDANKVAVACRIFPAKTVPLKKPARRLDPAPRGRKRTLSIPGTGRELGSRHRRCGYRPTPPR